MKKGQRKNVKPLRGDESKQIIDDYMGGFSMETLKRRYRRSVQTIREILERQGIPIRSLNFYKIRERNPRFGKKLSEEHKARIAGGAKKRMGENNGSWKGGIRISKHRTGRKIRIILCPKHPSADSNGYVSEHRLVMEKLLRRNLLKEEVIHHIDGNPLNNDPDNLMLFPNNQVHLAYHRKIRGKKNEA